MSITVNTNMSSLISQKSLLNATNSMNTALQRMSTGYRINSSKDDAAGMAISNKFEYKISSYKVANSNAQMGQSMLETANGSLSNINSMLQRMRDLTEQAANGTYGDDERNAMQMEINALTEEIYRVKDSTEFNGQNLFVEVPESSESSVMPTLTMSSISEKNWADTENQIIGISSAADLVKFAELVNSGKETKNRTFVLTDNIDLSSVDNWTPIGNNNKAFCGNFNGNNYTISNLTIDTSSDYQGLFGVIKGSEIKNLQLENFYIKTTGKSVGSLSANVNGATISNIVVKNATCCNISSSSGSSGGIIGSLFQSTVTDCNIYESNVSGSSSGIYVGGAFGYVGYSTINNCKSVVNCNGVRMVGGFVGYALYSNITQCESYGTVAGVSDVGGFCGYVVSSKGYNYAIDDCIGAASNLSQSKTDNGAFAGHISDYILQNCSYGNNTANLPAVGNQSSITMTDLGSVTSPAPPSSIEHKVNLQVGINNDENSVITVDTGFTIGDLKVSLLTDDSARDSLDILDALMEKVTNKMTEFGALQNRLESVIEAQNTQIQTMTSANSLIKDADIAEESSNYIKSQILQQTTASLLSTANQCPSIALQLI